MCDDIKQNSYDINTNQTLLKKKKPNPYSLEKKPLGKNTLEKNKKKKKTTL